LVQNSTQIVGGSGDFIKDYADSTDTNNAKWPVSLAAFATTWEPGPLTYPPTVVSPANPFPTTDEFTPTIVLMLQRLLLQLAYAGDLGPAVVNDGVPYLAMILERLQNVVSVNLLASPAPPVCIQDTLVTTTAANFPDYPCSEVMIQAALANTDKCLIGSGTGQYLELPASATITIAVSNSNQLARKSNSGTQTLNLLIRK